MPTGVRAVSRAFVKEGDGPEPLPRTPPALPHGAPNLVTPEGAARFRARRDALASERAGLADGGLAVARRAAIDDELRWLDDRLAGFVVRECPADPDRVGFGCEVTLRDDEGERTWRIVGVDEADPGRGRLSWVSPLARALLGAREGDEVRWVAPTGERSAEVVRVGSV